MIKIYFKLSETESFLVAECESVEEARGLIDRQIEPERYSIEEVNK